MNPDTKTIYCSKIFLDKIGRKKIFIAEIDDLSFEVHFEKTRGVREERNRPFIAKITTYLNQNGKEALKWECCPLQSSSYEKVINLTNQGKTNKEIIFEVGIDKSNVSKYQKRAREEGRLD